MLVHVEDALIILILCLQSLWPAVPQVQGVVSRVSPPHPPPTPVGLTSYTASTRWSPWGEPVNMPDPIQKCFVVSYGHYGQPELGWTVYVGSDFPHPFQLFFQRRHGSWFILCKTDRIRLDGLFRFWQNAFGLEASWCAEIIRPSFWQDATSPLPVWHFQTWFRSSTDVPDNTEQNQPRSNLVLADCVRFWPNRSGPEASWCARIIQHASGQCFPANLDWMWIRSGMFTGGVATSVTLSPPTHPPTHTHNTHTHTHTHTI